eukprot:CAMPEP_0115561868 /NCGR_PEP_ID=MMETSP0271-20121206/101205_1 /TAXON_ID=71861 /ORGANISM="Scrippsiella trochoidea, Strain CCMP3099" /LENGTH=126 /DNA_ID=CAMNT_0002995987 /DNA_START=356 /DNA_END=733 /DNA_ORIENTATION=-
MKAETLKMPWCKMLRINEQTCNAEQSWTESGKMRLRSGLLWYGTSKKYLNIWLPSIRCSTSGSDLMCRWKKWMAAHKSCCCNALKRCVASPFPRLPGLQDTVPGCAASTVSSAISSRQQSRLGRPL